MTSFKEKRFGFLYFALYFSTPISGIFTNLKSLGFILTFIKLLNLFDLIQFHKD